MYKDEKIQTIIEEKTGWCCEIVDCRIEYKRGIPYACANCNISVPLTNEELESLLQSV